MWDLIALIERHASLLQNATGLAYILGIPNNISIYQMLLAVPTTSVKSDGIFSSYAYLCRFKSSLSDTTLNTV